MCFVSHTRTDGGIGATPTLSSITPSVGSGGDLVTFYGTQFVPVLSGTVDTPDYSVIRDVRVGLSLPTHRLPEREKGS